ncbi:MAG: LacI family DNA-binding transcriptional regulator [Chloroflexota bacterium]
MPKRRRTHITQSDVATHANVSQAMVSYVVNNNSNISIPTETRQRILEAIDELGYVPNITARRLRTNKTLTIAGIIPDIMNPFYPAFERGIQDVVDANGYDLIMYNTDGSEEKERKYLRSLLQGRVDALVGVFFYLNARDLLPFIEPGRYVVRLEATPKQTGSFPLDNIFVDNIAAATVAVEHLIERGHRQIGMLTCADGPAQRRVIGYTTALEQHGLERNPKWLAEGTFNEVGGYEAMNQLLTRQIVPTAVFAANDLMALGAMMAIREAGLSIPDDIAIVGFDDIVSARLVYPGLTTIAQPQRQMGQRAAEMLFERLTGSVSDGGRSEQMPFELVVRGST